MSTGAATGDGSLSNAPACCTELFFLFAFCQSESPGQAFCNPAAASARCGGVCTEDMIESLGNGTLRRARVAGGRARMMHSDLSPEQIAKLPLEKFLGKRGWTAPSEWM